MIDGDHAWAQKLISALTGSGFEVMIASSGPEGLKLAEELPPDAIIIWDSPPQIDGFRLCQQVRQMFDLPLILLGNKPEAAVYTQDLKVPTDWNYYMHLPVSYEVLVAWIKALLWRFGRGEKPDSVTMMKN